MGMVYEVEHARTGERLALKVLLSTVGSSPEALERFKREARASARIKSENVVRVTDADIAPELDGAPFLVMELLEGTDIEKAANASCPTPSTVVAWLRQVARAIDKAHRLGIVHRDLKPENLFLANVEDRAPIVKILDFGIARVGQEGATVTGSGQVLGTPKYMAPEQAAVNQRVSPATDLYALGMVAYRLILGESYYQHEDVMSILGQLLHGPLQPPSVRNPNLGAALDAWFMKACHKDPGKRFVSAVVQVEALAEALGLPTVPIEAARDRSVPVDVPLAEAPLMDGTPISSPPAPSQSTSPRFVRWRTRRSVLVLSGAVAAAAMATIGVAASFSHRSIRTNHLARDPTLETAPPPARPSVRADAPESGVPPTGIALPQLAPSTPAGPLNMALVTPPPAALAAPVRSSAYAGGRKKSRAAVRPPAVAPAPPEVPAAETEDPFRDQK
jgi:serine/threonine-protein kinase